MEPIKIASVLITNPERNLFYLQQKDEFYQFPEYRLMLTFFGGHVEKDETPENTIKRELFEELAQVPAEIICSKVEKLFSSKIVQTPGGERDFSLFESVIPTEQLEIISKYPINEGKAGILVPLADIGRASMIPQIKKVLDEYLHAKACSRKQ